MSALKNLSAAQRNRLLSVLKGQQSQSKWNAYYSRVRFTAASRVDTATTSSFQLPAGAIVTAFGYTRTGDMAAAGLAGTTATIADTNIITANQTIASERVLIMGLGIMALAQSDAQFLKQLDQSTSVKIKLNGTTDYLMGIPSMSPGPGGLFGSSEAQSAAPDLQAQVSRSFGVITNGLPHTSNFYPLPEPMLWGAAGQADSTFAVELKVERAVATIPTFGYGAGPRAAVAGGATTSGTAPYITPAAGSVFVDYMVVVVGCTINLLSSN
jgi:hypothetical protein